MNSKQKLGYTLLGAGVMAVGIIIGQIITPDIKAQTKSVFDNIYCRQIVVEDAEGKPQIILADNRIDVFNKQKEGFISLIAGNEGNQLLITNKVGKAGFSLLTVDKGVARGNILTVSNEQGQTGIVLISTILDNSVRVFDKQGKYTILK